MTVRWTTREELLAEKREILERLHLSEQELQRKVRQGGLAGTEWAAWSEIEDIEYLLSE